MTSVADTAVSWRSKWRAILADVAVVTATPFAGRNLERIDEDGLSENLAFLLDNGIQLLVSGGNTGEFAALTPDEALAVTRRHVAAGAGRARVIAAVGYRLDDVLELGRKSLDSGADALMLHPPPHPFAGEPGLLEYYFRVADALPGVPLILYLRGRQLSPAAIGHLAGIPDIVGVKVGFADPDYFASLVAAAPDVAWVCGVAEGWALPFQHKGAVGFTSGIANFAPRHSLAVMAALRSGDVATADQLIQPLRPIESLRARHTDANNVGVIKAALDLTGHVGGGLRPPLAELSEPDRAELAVYIDDLGIPIR
jgi:4-hydroxy-tetrahydrodipicolinate synthase